MWRRLPWWMRRRERRGRSLGHLPLQALVLLEYQFFLGGVGAVAEGTPVSSYADCSISAQVTSRPLSMAMRPRSEVSVLSAASKAILRGLPARTSLTKASTASMVISRLDLTTTSLFSARCHL